MKAATLHDTPLRETPLHDATPPNAAPPHVDEPDEAVHDIADEAIDVAMWANDAKHQVDAVVRDNP